MSTLKPRALSYSRLNSLRNCPRSYALEYIYKVKHDRPSYFIFGGAYHEIMENFVKHSQEDPHHSKKIDDILQQDAGESLLLLDGKQIEDLKSVVANTLEMPLFKTEWYLKGDPEKRFSFNEDFVPTDYFADDVAWRGVGDFVLVHKGIVQIVDYKSSHQLITDPLQLKMYGLFLKKAFPEAKTIIADYYYGALKYVKRYTITDADLVGLEKYLKEVRIKAFKMEQENNFPETLNKFCGSCPFNKTCDAYNDYIQKLPKLQEKFPDDPEELLTLRSISQALHTQAVDKLKEIIPANKSIKTKNDGTITHTMSVRKNIVPDAALILAQNGVPVVDILKKASLSTAAVKELLDSVSDPEKKDFLAKHLYEESITERITLK